MRYCRSGYSQQKLNNVEMICFDNSIYVQLTLRRHVIDWYRFYTNQSGGSCITNTVWQVWYWKGLLIQAELSVKTCKKCQQLKNRKTIYAHLPPKIIAVLKPWNSVHTNLVGPYYKPIRPNNPGGVIIKKYVSLACMTMIDISTGWFEIAEFPCFGLAEVARGNNEYIDYSSARLIQMFNKTWLWRYPRPHKVVFDKW